MSIPTENETWIIETGDVVIQKKARNGINSLSPIEKLINCLWIVDYCMNNAGDLVTAHELHADFQSEGTRLAEELQLQATLAAFSLSTGELQKQYFDRFEAICNEIRRVY